ncbi:MAG: hypothetical protein IH987_04480 [Planctomycetes bacterium]|nr:hypothetical protein [Planctomycetota bacterium]
MPPVVVDRTFPPYADPLLRDVVDRTGHPLRLVEEERIGYDSELRMADRNRSAHEVAYVVPAYREYRTHFLVSGAYKILRIHGDSSNHRLMPVGALGEQLPIEDHADLQRKLPRLPSEHLNELSVFLRHGITRHCAFAMLLRTKSRMQDSRNST